MIGVCKTPDTILLFADTVNTAGLVSSIFTPRGGDVCFGSIVSKLCTFAIGFSCCGIGIWVCSVLGIFLRLRNEYDTASVAHSTMQPRTTPSIVDPEITDEASSFAEICAAACAAAITGRISVAVLVAVAVADTDEDVVTEYDPDALADPDADGVLVCFGEMLPDDEGELDAVGKLVEDTVAVIVTELLIDPDPVCVGEDVDEPDKDGVCV